MFITRRKSGDDADSRNKSANKAARVAAAAYAARQVENENSITLDRSDGLRHDLNSVMSSHDVSTLIKESSTRAQTSPSPSTPPEEHDRISISRSDGVTHDLIRMFRSSDSNTVDALPPAPATMAAPQLNAPPERPKGRSISLTFKEFAKMATSSFKTASSTQLPTTGTFSCSAAVPHAAPIIAPKTVRIVHMSDTHNFLDKNRRLSFLPHGDILVHTGSFTNRGTEEEFAAFNDWLGSVTDLYHYRIICLGSRDVKLFGNDWEEMKRMLPNATHVLCHNEVTVLGIRFYGSPWHWGHKHNYTIRAGAPTSTSGRFEDIPEGVHVVLTHVPAYQRLDATTAAELKEHWGSRELAEHLRRVRPGLHLHGHVKDSRGVLPAFGNSPLSINSAMTDKDITVLYAAPHVIKATQTLFGANNNALQWAFTLDSLDG